MSVLIKGLEMPTNGNETIIKIQPDGTVLDQYSHHLAITAVPVPTHGRLKDADALITSIQEELWDWDRVDGISASTVLKQTITDIKNAPTIIPAEEAEKET